MTYDEQVRLLTKFFNLHLENGRHKEIKKPTYDPLDWRNNAFKKFMPDYIVIDNNSEIRAIYMDIYQNIDVKQLHQLLHSTLSGLLDNQETIDERTASNLSSAIQKLTNFYFVRELDRTKCYAMGLTMASMLLIITIPFVFLIYNYIEKKLVERQTLQLCQRQNGLLETYFNALRKEINENPCKKEKSFPNPMNLFFEGNKLRGNDNSFYSPMHICFVE